MRTDREIEAEVWKLRAALTRRRWSANAREQIEGQIEVLEKRMEPETVEARWYNDETADEFTDGDNDLWLELDQTARWLQGMDGYSAPSQGL
jgi:hypothetical protein